MDLHDVRGFHCRILFLTIRSRNVCDGHNTAYRRAHTGVVVAVKFDDRRCLVREKYQPWNHWANLGEAMAETSRHRILEPTSIGDLAQFINPDGPGFVRHWLLKDVAGWDESDVSGDAFFAYAMARRLAGNPIVLPWYVTKIPGTDKRMTPACWCLIHEFDGALNVCNRIQGNLFDASVRWSDDLEQFEVDESKVQDWLNFIACYLFLKAIGKTATLTQSAEKCLAAIRKYYLEGPDAEPNSQFIVQLYERNLR